MGKTIYISDKDALDVDRVIVSSTGMEYKLLYSCDEIDNYEKRLKADMVAMLEDLLMEIKHTITMEEDTPSNEDLVKRNNVMKVIQFRIDKLRGKEDENNN